MKYIVVASTGKVMSEPFSDRVSAQQYADALMMDFPETTFWVTEA